MSNHFNRADIDSSRVPRYPAKLRGRGLLNAERSGMNPPASRSMTSTVLGPALLLAMAGLAACGGDDPPASADQISEKVPLCVPSPRTTMSYEHVCLKLADLFDTAKITAAKKAAAENAVIVLEGGTMAQLRTALGLSDDSAGDAAAVKSTPPLLPPLNPGDPVESIASLSTDVVAFQISPDGTQNEFEYVLNKDLPEFNNPYAELAALDSWEGDIDQQLEAKPQEKSTSPGGAWFQQQSRRSTIANAVGSLTSITSTYRLNGKDAVSDYYMLTNRTVGETTAPLRCSAPLTGFGEIGPYTYHRDTYIFDVFPANRAKVFETQPSTSVGSSSQSFSIGASLSEKGPGVSASYSESFSTSNIRTERIGGSGNLLVKWQYPFETGIRYSPKRCPNSETRSSVTLVNATIVEVPKGGNWNATVLNNIWYNNETWFGGAVARGAHRWNTSFLETVERFEFVQPQFSVSTNSVTIPVGTLTSAFSINAAVPLSTPPQFSLSWRITDIPQWLVANRTTGSGSSPITLFAQPGTPSGSTAFLQIDTSPSLGANSVEKGPLVVQVRVQ